MQMTSLASFSRFLKNDPQGDPMPTWWDDHLPIWELKTEAFDYFRFDGWNIKDSENPSNTSYPSVIWADEDFRQNFDDDDAYQLHTNRKLKEVEEWERIVVSDFDSSIEYGLKMVEPLKLAEKERCRELASQYPGIVSKRPQKLGISHSYYGDPSFLSVFRLFVKWIDNYFDNDDSADVLYPLPSNRVGTVVTVVSAMALLAMAKANAAALKNETWATTVFLLDAVTLVTKAKNMVESEYLWEIEDQKKKQRSGKRHEKTYAIKEFTFQKENQFGGKNYSKLKITRLIFPEVEAFAKEVGQPFQERGFKTVYDWILKQNSPSP